MFLNKIYQAQSLVLQAIRILYIAQDDEVIVLSKEAI